MIGALGFKNTYRVKCIRKGSVAWEETANNTVVIEGLNDMLTKYFKGVEYTAQHFIGLKGEGVVSSLDTLAEHPNWEEIKPYTGTRFPLNFLEAEEGSLTTDSVGAYFKIITDDVVHGVFVADQAESNIGLLFAALNFESFQEVYEGDAIVISCTFTQGNF